MTLRVSIVVVVGGGVAGPLRARSARRPRRDVAAAREGAGRGLEQLARAGRRRGGARRRTTRRRCTRRTRCAPGAGSAARAPSRVLTEEAPARIADLVDARRRVRRRPRPRGRPLAAPRRRTPAARETGKAISAALAARVREHPRITLAEGERVVSLWEADGRCVGVVTDRARDRRARRRCSRPAATRRSGSARRTRPARSARGSRSPTAPAPRSPTSSSCSSIRPRSSTTASCSPRRCAARARCSSTTTATASPTSSRRATSSRARSPSAARPGSTCARSSAGASRA